MLFPKSQVYIIGHIPPGSDERQTDHVVNGHTTFSEANNLKYINLIRKYAAIIQGQFFGHLHSDTFRIVYDEGKFWFCMFFFSQINEKQKLFRKTCLMDYGVTLIGTKKTEHWIK